MTETNIKPTATIEALKRIGGEFHCEVTHHDTSGLPGVRMLCSLHSTVERIDAFQWTNSPEELDHLRELAAFEARRAAS